MIGRLLGIDHGNKRIGLAISDATGLIARELQVLRRTTRAEDFTTIARIAAGQQAAGIIVGLPSNPDLPEGVHNHAITVLRWAEELRVTVAVPVILWDEQLTSADAQALARKKRRRPADPIDDLAARLILQSYLDALRDGLAVFPPEAAAKDAR